VLSRDNLNAIYEDLILNNNDDFQPPKDLTDALIVGIASANPQSAPTIILKPTDLFYLFESSKIFKVGGIASPCATIEWP
jgi:hypothetical protein